MEHPPPPEPVPTPRRRSRGRRILIGFGIAVGVLVLAFLFIAPPVIASTIKKQFQAALNDRIDGTSTVGAVSFSWTGTATIRDVDIKDKNGATLAQVKAIKAKVGIFSALSGQIDADVRVDGPRVEIRRMPDGRLNLAAAMKPSVEATGTPEPPQPGAKKDLPKLDVNLTVTDGLLIVAGEKETTQLDVSGTYAVKAEGGHVTINGKTLVKDGEVTTAADADLRDHADGVNPASKADIKFDKVPLDARMSPLLELLHPAFSAASGQLGGTLNGTINVNYPGAIADGEESLLKNLNGAGRIDIQNCTITGSNLIGEIFKALGSEQREIKLNPIEFKITNGRIIYDRPWQWTISGSETTFTGSIGLDRTLDLVWNVPITEKLADKLKLKAGETYQIPIGGTVTSPRLDWKGLFKEAAKDKLEDAAKGKLEDLLGGKDEKRAQKLLEEADALAKEGKKGEAAAKYRKIKDDYRKTRVYKDNQDRIDKGMEEK